MDISRNLEIVHQRINRAARTSGRDPAAIKLVAVSKRIDVARIAEAIRLGVAVLGENRVQELVSKWDKITEPVEWHLIGTLQTNKVKYIIDKVSLIHSLDRWPLAVEVSERAAAAGRKLPVLVQLNVAGEATKHGLGLEEADDFIREAAVLPGLNIQGLMTIAPAVADPEEVRPVFRQLRKLAARLKDLNLPGVKMDWLSMGMTGDYEVAVEEGSNLVRIGTGIFGERH